jgi:hypothetical protein
VLAFSIGGEFHALVGERAAAALAADAAAALGIREGPTCTRLRVGSRGAQVVELAARVGSRSENERCIAETGVDLNWLAVKAALGARITPVELGSARRAAA